MFASLEIVSLYTQEDIERRLEEGLNTGDPVDFEDLLRTKPDEVISYLADSGTVKLGSFTTEVNQLIRLGVCISSTVNVIDW